MIDLKKSEVKPPRIYKSSTSADNFEVRRLNEKFHQLKGLYSKSIDEYFEILRKLDNPKLNRENRDSNKKKLQECQENNLRLETLISQK
tara:strand:+ start:7159 stop:7425 length:267 start_codon:yes stop_codon:yes gene_type:complete